VAQIYGTVNGDIVATKRIEMGRTAKVTGNIQTPTLAIENGAIFEGGCRMVQLKEQTEKGADAASASSASASAGSGASKSGSSRSSYSSSSSSATPDASAASDVTDATDVAS
jgi:cytoskeletal protein CcmA (bactofilin family)